MEIKEPTGFPVIDDSMFPTLQRGSMVTLEMLTIDQIKNGDIIAFTQKSKKDVFFRKCLFTDEDKNNLILFPLNNTFKTIIYELKNISILGIVKKIMTDID
jgi:SOS-response transcriptional repressor LexA